MKGKAIIFFLFCVVASLKITAKEIYVAKNGSDANTGTIDSPFLTITKAASEAVAGDTVIIREGTYEEILKPANSGTAGNPIIFTSFPGERVIVSAMQPLNGWVNDSGSIYKTVIDFPSLEQDNFVMNGNVALDLARWPNNDDEKPFTLNSRRNTGGSGPDVINNAFLESSEIPNIDWTGGAVFFYGDKSGAGWIAWKALISNSSVGRVTFELNKNPSWIRTFHSPKDLGDFYLEGVKGALDYQNEWWYDTTTNELFVQLPNGSMPQDDLVKMRRRRLTIDLNNRSYIEIRNMAVFGGGIELKTNSNNNTIYGVSSFYGNHTQGVFTGFSANKPSIEVNGTRNVIEKCEIAFGAATGVRLGGSFNELKNSSIHDFDYLGSYDAPLMARGGDDNKITGNTIFNGGRDGISFFGNRCEIAYNDVYKSNLINDDCGTFYTVGGPQNTEIHHNWFHDIASRGDKFKAAGIYLDNDAEAFSVHHNVVWNTEWTGVQINWDGKDIDVFNNTFWNNSEVMGAWHKEGTSFTNVKVWNNLGDNDKWEPQSDKQNNLVVGSEAFSNTTNGDFTLRAGSSPIDAGRIIIGITDDYTGLNPDVGAYEFEGYDWFAGISWNPLLGPTGQGCYGLPGEDCILLPEEDADNDGVSDANDICPDTPVNDTVDSNGCTVFTLPTDNFIVLVTGESCRDAKNGSIFIKTNENQNYTAVIQGNNLTQAFTTETLFDQLSEGTYVVCITIAEEPSYKQCFELVVTAPENLTVSSIVNASAKKIELDLSGGELYRIQLNGVLTVTDKNTITLELKDGKNDLLVSTNIDCQGKYTENINIEDGIYIYPNPFNNQLAIDISNTKSGDVLWQVFSYQGKLVKQGKQKLAGSSVIADTSILTSGSYLIKITTPETIVYKQLIKE
ncbi:T9SS type A sorting domain-containing protein [Aquimarina sp. RZ0]|uniref:T9SS type A sorting domain-containing protein n=1 Tax=Aquimarina sp. RZ0 TaxID=2607730 RepID=UPI00165F6BE1|nr:T9SS type A sorting domain-containing protein [Aquimarina sp. RZ0]